MYLFLKTCYFTLLPVIFNYYVLYHMIENDIFSSVFKRLYSMLKSRARVFIVNEEPLMMAVVNSADVADLAYLTVVGTCCSLDASCSCTQRVSVIHIMTEG